MDPLLKLCAKVPVRIIPPCTQYEKGDIIMFIRGGIYIIHEIVASYIYKNIRLFPYSLLNLIYIGLVSNKK